jgi:hypothetical protein
MRKSRPGLRRHPGHPARVDSAGEKIGSSGQNPAMPPEQLSILSTKDL